MDITTLVTGLTGFIGSKLKEGSRGLVRSAANARPQDVVGDLQDMSSLYVACAGMHTVIHCAGYAHAVTNNDDATHWRVNYRGTCNLIDAACKMGVRQFVFLSSVKAVGEPGRVVATEAWPLPPRTAYGKSKRAAEDYILARGKEVGMHVVNLRLAMTYGPGGNGNLERMVRAVRAGYFPPIPQTRNLRSLVHVDDVISAIRCVLSQPIASGKTYNIASPTRYSSRDLYNTIRDACGLAPIRWGVPLVSLKLGGWIGDGLNRVLGDVSPLTSPVVARLSEPECYSAALIETELNWKARIGLREGLRGVCASEKAI